jgi:hypothetical protein
MQDIFVAVCRAGKLADYIVQNAVANIVLRCVSHFSTLQNILMSNRNVSVLIGPNISPNVKLWAFFIAIIEQTGTSGDMGVRILWCAT